MFVNYSFFENFFSGDVHSTSVHFYNLRLLISSNVQSITATCMYVAVYVKVLRIKIQL